MTSLNSVIYSVLCVEVGALLVMIAPMPAVIRGGIVRWIGTSSIIAALQRPIMYFSVVVLAMWAATIRDLLRYQEQYNEVKVVNVELANKLQVEVGYFRSQRNFYLSGFCLLLLLVIYRIYGQLKELNRLEATSTALKKQADGAMQAYKAMEAEKDELQKKVTAAQKKAADADPDATSSGTTSGGASDDATLELERLRAQNDKLAAERTKAEKEAEALKRQSEGLAKEYDRLTTENKGLQNKLADFELVMGDAAKKSK